MKKTDGSDAEIKRMQGIVVDLSKKVDLLRQSIRAVAILLRENGKVDGAKCEEMLSSAAAGRKEWVFNLARNPNLLTDASARPLIISEGEAAAASLRKASLELAKVTSQLQSN